MSEKDDKVDKGAIQDLDLTGEVENASEVKEPKFSKLHPREILRFAGKILLVAAIIFIAVALAESFFGDCNKGVEKVWNFTSVALNSIVSLILGFYFGKKDT
jgi:hypothetical protein